MPADAAGGHNVAYSDHIIYIDESGDHGLKTIDPEYPVFVLPCCIFRKSHYIGNVVPLVQSFKFRFFGHDAVVLHSRDIRKQNPPFGFLKSEAKRASFMEELTGLIDEIPFVLVTAVIKKEELRRRNVDPANPYDIALTFCMERVFAYLRDQGDHERTTHVVVEKRGDKEDDELELAFRRIVQGENYLGALPLQIIFADKKINSSGLQIADLVAHPIGRHILKPEQPNRAYDVIEPKFRRSPGGRTQGYGLKIFP